VILNAKLTLAVLLGTASVYNLIQIRILFWGKDASFLLHCSSMPPQSVIIATKKVEDTICVT